MNVPDVVQALSTMTVFIAVAWSPIQFWFGAMPNSSNRGSRPSAARTSLNRPSGAMMKIQSIVMAAELAIAGK